MAKQQQQPSALFTETVSNLIGGVSQQPDSVRLPSQSTEVLNALLTPAEGFKRRPPTQYLQDLTSEFSSWSDGCFAHAYNRDLTEKYVILIVDGDLKVFSLIDGSEQTVVYPDGKGYLASDDPRAEFRAVTVGDYTFIVNKTVTVEDLSDLSPAALYEALAWVRIGDYGVDYSVKLDGTNYRISTDLTHRDEVTTEFIASALFAKIPSGKGLGKIYLSGTFAIGDTVTITRTSTGGGTFVYTVKAGLDGAVESLHDIARGLSDVMNQSALATSGTLFAFPVAVDDDYAMVDGLVISNITSGTVYTWSIATSGTGTVSATNTTQANTYTITRNGSTLYIKRVDAADFTISAADGLGDQSVRAIKGQIQRFNDLPARAVDGFRIEVTGEEKSLSDNYHVIYGDASSATGDGVWSESLKAAELIALDASTMPHVLVRESDGTFSFQEAEWDNRLVGDLNSAPFPSFLDHKISDVFFYSDRLGFISEENVVLSQSGEYFKFFRKSVMQLLDEDVIDVSVGSEEIALLRHAVPHSSDLILWTDKQQFAFSGSPLLTAKTVSAPPITAFEASQRTKPIKLGKEIIFCVDRDSATKVMEFSVTRDAEGKPSADAFEITELVTSYLKGNPLVLAGADNLNLLGISCDENRYDFYVYSYLWNGQQLQHASWSTWRFRSEATIHAAAFVGNNLYLIIQRDSTVTLEVIEVTPEGKDEDSDHLVHLDLRMTDETAGVSVSYADGRTAWTLPVDIEEDAENPLKVTLRSSGGFTSTIELPDIQRPAPNVISCSGDYTSSAVWIGLAYETSADLSKLYKRDQSQDGRVITLSDAVTQVRHLDLKYTRSGYFTVEVTPTGRSSAYVYEFDGDTDVEQGTFRVPVLANNEKVQIVIKTSSHRPCSLSGFAWTGVINQTTSRRG